MKCIIKQGTTLTDKEIQITNDASLREFKSEIPADTRATGTYIMLQNENGAIFAQGILIPIAPVLFQGKTYSVLGFGGIISHQKGKGFGKQLLNSIEIHVKSLGKTAIGFCLDENIEFYRKCDYEIDTEVYKRFMYVKDTKKLHHDTLDKNVAYLQGTDNLFEEISQHPTEEILFPRKTDW